MLVAVLLATLPVIPGIAPAPDGPRPEAVQESLEDLLERARAERQRLQERLEPSVLDLVRRLEALERPARPETLDGIHAELVALGPEAEPLLVPHLDPGPAAQAEAKLRAEQVTRALVAMRVTTVPESLIALTSSASQEGRRNAIRVLGRARERERARGHLTVLYRTAAGETRREAAAALARLGGERSADFLQSALADDDPELVGAVLAAVAETPGPEATEAVLGLVRRPAGAARWIGRILDYLRLVPDAVDEGAVQDLLVLAGDTRLPAPKRVEVLDALPTFRPSLDATFRRRLDSVLSSPDKELREGGLVCLARLGDRSARRILIRTYDDDVERNQRWPAAYARRGRMLMRIEDYGDAAKDFQNVIDLHAAQGRSAESEIWIELARAHALDRRLRQAHEALRKGPIPRSVLARLAEDPDFAELADHSRYARVFGE